MISKWNTVTVDFAQSLFSQYFSGDETLSDQSFEIFVPSPSMQEGDSEFRVFVSNTLLQKDYLEYNLLIKVLTLDMPTDTLSIKNNFIIITNSEFHTRGVASVASTLNRLSMPEELKKEFATIAKEFLERSNDPELMKAKHMDFLPVLNSDMFEHVWNKVIFSNDNEFLCFRKEKDGTESYCNAKDFLPEETRYIKIRNYQNTEFVKMIDNILKNK